MWMAGRHYFIVRVFRHACECAWKAIKKKGKHWKEKEIKRRIVFVFRYMTFSLSFQLSVLLKKMWKKVREINDFLITILMRSQISYIYDNDVSGRFFLLSQENLSWIFFSFPKININSYIIFFCVERGWGKMEKWKENSTIKMIYSDMSNQYQWYCNKFVISARFSSEKKRCLYAKCERRTL